MGPFNAYVSLLIPVQTQEQDPSKSVFTFFVDNIQNFIPSWTKAQDPYELCSSPYGLMVSPLSTSAQVCSVTKLK